MFICVVSLCYYFLCSLDRFRLLSIEEAKICYKDTTMSLKGEGLQYPRYVQVHVFRLRLLCSVRKQPRVSYDS